MARRLKEKPLRPEYFQEVVQQANGFKAERDQARQELKYVLRHRLRRQTRCAGIGSQSPNQTSISHRGTTL